MFFYACGKTLSEMCNAHDIFFPQRRDNLAENAWSQSIDKENHIMATVLHRRTNEATIGAL